MEGSGEPEASGFRRWWQQFVGAGRWTYDVLRGHSWSRHLGHREK